MRGGKRSRLAGSSSAKRCRPRRKPARKPAVRHRGPCRSHGAAGGDDGSGRAASRRGHSRPSHSTGTARRKSRCSWSGPRCSGRGKGWRGGRRRSGRRSSPSCTGRRTCRRRRRRSRCPGTAAATIWSALESGRTARNSSLRTGGQAWLLPRRAPPMPRMGPS